MWGSERTVLVGQARVAGGGRGGGEGGGGKEDRKGPWHIYDPDIPEELLLDGEDGAAVGDFCAGDFSEGDPAGAPVHIDNA